MEYSKDIILGAELLNEKSSITKKLKKDKKDKKKQRQTKSRVLKFMNEHKFITSISIMCVSLIMLDFILVYSFVELIQKI